jgi:hypothetical protein
MGTHQPRHGGPRARPTLPLPEWRPAGHKNRHDIRGGLDGRSEMDPTGAPIISAAIFIALAAGVQPAQWIYYLPLLPLAALVLTGLYMFVQPYRE